MNRLAMFYALGVAPCVVAGELVRHGYAVGGIILAYSLGAVVAWTVRRSW